MKEIEVRPKLLREALSKKGILAVYFDLDDTLIATNKVFHKFIGLFIDSAIEGRQDLDKQEVRKAFDEIENASYKTLSVRPDKYIFVTDKLDSRFRTGQLFGEHVGILRQIYKAVPELLDGTMDTLNTFQDAGIPMSVVTHAEADWTNLKIDSLNLRKYFNRIEIVRTEKHKEPRDWKRAIKVTGYRPENALVVGDNLKGDVIAAMSIGVRNAIWIESKWSPYREGQIPEGVITIKNINEVLPALLK